jgi:DtxR family transcriptional regulator, Mn-dependent transcriptional regulator
MIEQQIDEILEAIWEAGEKQKPTRETVQARLGDAIQLSDENVKLLVDEGLLSPTCLTATSQSELLFTEAGKEKARLIIRRHRLAEVLVQDVLKDKNRSIEDVSCEFEHIKIPEVEESICILLGHPNESAKGRPIPPGRCCPETPKTPQKSPINLLELNPGDSGKIAFIRPKNHDRMHRLMSFGVNPGIIIQLHQKRPTIVIQYENTELAIDNDVAEDIYVSKI